MTLRQRLVHRGQILLLLACVWTAIGVGVVDGTEATAASMPHLLTPAPIRAACWFVSAAYAAWAAFRIRDRFAFGLLVVMPTVRCLSCLWSWLMWLVPAAPPGYERGWYWATFYALMVAFVIVEGRRKEPADEGAVL